MVDDQCTYICKPCTIVILLCMFADAYKRDINKNFKKNRRGPKAMKEEFPFFKTEIWKTAAGRKFPHRAMRIEIDLYKAWKKDTWKTYSTGIRKYKKFCMNAGWKTLPLEESKFLMYAKKRAHEDRNEKHKKTGVNVNTIRHEIDAISSWARLQGYPAKGEMWQLKKLMESIKKNTKQFKTPDRDPITNHEMLKAIAQMGDTRDENTIMAAWMACFLGLLRIGE